MLISQEVLKMIIDDWITPEKSLAKSCRGKFEEIPLYSDRILGTGFGYMFSTYNATARETQEKSLWVRLVIDEKKWVIFAQTSGVDIKPVIEIWDDRINICLDSDNLYGWEYLRIEALYDKLKPYVLYNISISDMEERNSQALVLGHCITDWLDKNRPIFKHPHPLEMVPLKYWHIKYETDDEHVSWANIPNFKIDIIDGNSTYHHLYGRYILHDMPEKDNKPYWVISDQPIPEYPIAYFNQEKRDQMFIYIFRQHVEYISPENEQWFTGYTKNLVESICEAIKDPNIPDWCIKIQQMYYQKALQYKRAEETLTTKRGELVRTHKESETDKEKTNMNELISQKKLISIFQKWIEPFIPENEGYSVPLRFQVVSNKFYWIIDGNTIAAQQCTEDDGTAYWRIYQNVNFDKPCLEIFPDHIRLLNDTGYFKAFSVDSIRDLARMIEKECFENKEEIYLDPVKKFGLYSPKLEEKGVRIDLKNVAVKVEHQNLNDYCIISIGRLNSLNKNKLLNMFPTAINSLKYMPRYPFFPLYQITITATLPNTPDFKICDSDVCNISIIDRTIISQIESSESDKNIRKWKWFDSIAQRLSLPKVSIPDELVKQARQNIDQIQKEENTMFSKADIDALKSIAEELNKLMDRIPGGQEIEYPGSATIDLKGLTEKIVNAAVTDGLNEAVEILKKSTGTVCCDTPNATGGFTPGEVSKLLKSMRDSSMILVPTVKEILINKPATIIFWSDGSKTTSVCDDADKFDPEVGISICIAKKYLGGTENLQLEARRALTRYERREAKKLNKNKKTVNNKSNQSSKKKK